MKKKKVLFSDNNSTNKTDYPRETKPGGKKKRKVLPLDNNSPNRTDYPRETESREQGDKTRRKKDKNTTSFPTEIRQVIKD